MGSRRSCYLPIKSAARLPDADRTQSQAQQLSALGGPSAATTRGSVHVGDRATVTPQGSAQLEGVEISPAAGCIRRGRKGKEP